MTTMFLVLIYVCFRYVCIIDPTLTKVMAVVALALSLFTVVLFYAIALRHIHP